MSDQQEIDIIVTDTAFSIVHDHREYLILSCDEDGRLVVSAPLFDEIVWEESTDIPTTPITVKILQPRQPKEMSLERKEATGGYRKKIRKIRERVPRDFAVERVQHSSEHGKYTPQQRKKTARKSGASRKYSLPSPGTPLDAWLRDLILEEILDSWAQHPQQSKSFTAEESHRIAKTVLGDDDHTSVMRVAGVRAALARGVYDVTLEAYHQNE